MVPLVDCVLERIRIIHHGKRHQQVASSVRADCHGFGRKPGRSATRAHGFTVDTAACSSEALAIRTVKKRKEEKGIKNRFAQFHRSSSTST